jgi:hypothetical protein
MYALAMAIVRAPAMPNLARKIIKLWICTFIRLVGFFLFCFCFFFFGADFRKNDEEIVATKKVFT